MFELIWDNLLVGFLWGGGIFSGDWALFYLCVYTHVCVCVSLYMHAQMGWCKGRVPVRQLLLTEPYLSVCLRQGLCKLSSCFLTHSVSQTGLEIFYLPTHSSLPSSWDHRLAPPDLAVAVVVSVPELHMDPGSPFMFLFGSAVNLLVKGPLDFSWEVSHLNGSYLLLFYNHMLW